MSVRNAFSQSIVWKVLLYISSVVLNIAIARFFQASASGWFYYLITILALIIQVVGLSLESGLIYFTAKKQISVSRLASLAISWAFFAGLLSLIALIFLYSELDTGPISYNWLLICSVFYIVGNLILSYLSSFFYARLNFRIPQVIGIITNIILTGLLIFSDAFKNAGITTLDFMIVFLVSFFIQAIVLMLFFKRTPGTNEEGYGLPSKTEIGALARYTAKAYFANILFFFLYRIDYYFVSRYCSDEDLGNYIQVSRLAHLFFIIPGILAGVVFSLTARDEKAMVHKILLPLCRILFFFFLITCLFLAIVGKQLFPFIFGYTFSGMYQPFLLLIPGIVFLCALYPLSAFYAGKNSIQINIKGSILALVIIVTGDLLLIPKFGINAAAFVSSIGYLSYYAYSFIHFVKEFQLNPSNFFLLKKTDIQLCLSLARRNYDTIP